MSDDGDDTTYLGNDETEGSEKSLEEELDDEVTGVRETALVECSTTAGPFTISLIKSWAPIGYERALTLFERSYYDHSHFFRVIPNFLVQFGISYTDDQDLKHFADSTIKDDPGIGMPFEEGLVSFAGSGPDSRTSQLFIAYGPSRSLGTEPWETPIGEVVDGMANMRKLYSEYGDGKPHGRGPEQYKIRNGGKSFMNENYPNLDAFLTCKTTRKKFLNGQLIKEKEVPVTEKLEKPDEADKTHTRKTALRQKAKRLVEDRTPNEMVFTASIIIAVLLTIIVCKRRGKKPTVKNS